MIDKGNIKEGSARYSYPVDPDTTKTYEEGRVAVMGIASDGTGMATPATGATGEIVLGLFWGNRTTQQTEVVTERVRFVDSNNNATNTVQLRGTSVNTSSSTIRVTNPTDGSAYTITTHYTISAGGVLTRVSSIPAGGTVDVRYERNILASELPYKGVDYNRGSDDTLGFVPGYGGGLCTICERGKIPTDQYEEGLAYTPGAALYISARGRLTSASGTKKFPGWVEEPPTAAYPFLIVNFACPNPAVTT